VHELRRDYPIEGLLKQAALPRSTFYYQQKKLHATDKYAALKIKIKEIYHGHKGRYGYRRVTAALRRLGHVVNHKLIQRLMGILGLKSLVRPKKYRSHKGEIGAIAPNVLKRQFKATSLNQKWVTDVTEFRVAGEKLYLSPIMDLFNRRNYRLRDFEETRSNRRRNAASGRKTTAAQRQAGSALRPGLAVPNAKLSAGASQPWSCPKHVKKG